MNKKMRVILAGLAEYVGHLLFFGGMFLGICSWVKSTIVDTPGMPAALLLCAAASLGGVVMYILSSHIENRRK